MSRQQWIILLAAMLVTFVTGSIHSFSVFLVPFETLLQSSRAQVSLFYSFALVFLTISVLFGYRIYSLLRPPMMVACACGLAGLGLLLSATATTWFSVFIGYSVLFGIANGVAYGYVLQLAGRVLSEHKGFAMAAVTAAYAVGSVVFSLALAELIQRFSLTITLITMGSIIIGGGFMSALIFNATGIDYNASEDGKTDQLETEPPSASLVLWLWIAYGCAVIAGLMAIGHAAGIVQTLGGNYSTAIWGAVFIGVGSAIGGFFIGAIINRNNMRLWLLILPVVSACFLVGLIFTSTIFSAVALLSIIGFSYGALISVYPFTISELFGNVIGPKVYGQVFTAWGFAGLVGPWLAGQLFDVSGNYSVALIVAAILALVSTMAYYFLSRTLRA